jgi:hypothetical protein
MAAVAVLPTAVPFDHDFGFALENAKLRKVAVTGAGFHNPVQQCVGDTPLLMVYLERDGLVVEAQDLPAALVVVAINKPDNVADGNRLPAQTLFRLFANLGIGTVQVDRRVRD